MSNSRDHQRKNKNTVSLPIMSLIFMGIGAIAGYFGSEIILVSWSHPLHWITGAVSANISFLAYMFLYERYGTSL